MNKVVKFLALTLTAFMILSCANNIYSKGSISIPLPGNSRAASKAEYTDYYLVAISENGETPDLENENTIWKTGKPGSTVLFEDLEPGKYGVLAAALKKAVTKTDNNPDVEISEESFNLSDYIILGDAFDVVNVKPGETSPVILKLISSVISEINIFPNEDYLDYMTYEDAASFLKNQGGSLKSVFNAQLVTENNQSIEVPLESLDFISVSMPSYEMKEDPVPFVGKVPFSFEITNQNDRTIELQTGMSGQVKEFTLDVTDIKDAFVTIKYPATKKFGDSEESISIPAFFGSASKGIISQFRFFNIPETYYLYTKEGTPEAVSDEIGEVEISFEETSVISLEKTGTEIKVTAAKDKNEESSTEIIQSVKILPSEYAYYENEEDLTCVKTTKINVVPYTLSEVKNRDGSTATEPLSKGTYYVSLENSADEKLNERNTSWSCSSESKSVFPANITTNDNRFFFEVSKQDGSRVTIEYFFIDENGNQFASLSKLLFVAEGDSSIDEPAGELRARLKITDENKNYVLKGSDGNIFALCTSSTDYYGKDGDRSFQPSDFEFYSIIDGEEKIIEVENPDEEFHIEMTGNADWTVIGKNIPLRLVRNYPVEVYNAEVTLKRYSKLPDIKTNPNKPSELIVSLYSTEGVRIYSEGAGDYQRDIDSIDFYVFIEDKDGELNLFKRENINGNTLETTIDFTPSEELQLDPGEYPVYISTCAYVEDYKDLFLATTTGFILTVSQTSSNGNGNN